ncbi:beta-glucoside-specific PTS transporter subunit IIABC [Microbacterium arborescens]|uniref:beta-glucoside-specific PTS transporter subunit IIABC n=1 Tax=Microbacterium arborescens TaxID=33883 RepID=UPI003C77CBAA
MAKIDYSRLADDVLDGVGGEQNVKSVSHCATRLRFVLKDNAQADKDAIAKVPGVISTVESGGQFQVVVGNSVPLAYAALEKTHPALTEGADASLTATTSDAGKSNPLTRVLNAAIGVVSAIFAPIIGTLCAAGILKGLLMIVSTAGWLSTTSPTYQILWTAADAFFFFLPLILAVPAARKFGANIYTALTLAGALVYTQVQNINLVLNDEAVSMSLRAFQQAGGAVDFFGIPVVLQSYTSTVIPIILAVYLQSLIEKLIAPRIHDSVRNFIVPLVVLVVVFPVALLALGPVGNLVGQAIADFFLLVQGFSPVLTGFLFAALWQVMVVFGIHWAMVPVFINNLATAGYDTFKPLVWPAVFGQAGAALGVFLRLKERRVRGIAGSAVVAALFGVTEPAVYGVNVPRKRVFGIAILSAGIGGAIVGGAGAKVYGYGLSGILTLPLGYGDPLGLGDTFLWLIIGTVVAFVLSTVLTFFFGITKKEFAADRAASAAERAEASDPSTGTRELVVPVAGTVIPLAEVEDPVFSSGAMGAGFAVRPTDGKVVAPVSGVVEAVLPHAIGIRTADGVEVLVHVGIDTVQMNGTAFTSKVAQGQQVSVGEALIEADLEAIIAAGYDTTTVVAVTNSDDLGEVRVVASGPTTAGSPALTIAAIVPTA